MPKDAVAERRGFLQSLCKRFYLKAQLEVQKNLVETLARTFQITGSSVQRIIGSLFVNMVSCRCMYI